MPLLTIDNYRAWTGRDLFVLYHNGTSYGPMHEAQVLEEVQSILRSANKRTQIDELRAKSKRAC